LSSTLKLNLFLTMSQITRKFRLLVLPYLTIPPSVWLTLPKLIKMNSEDVKMRIELRGKTEHLDYFETLMPFDRPVPQDQKEIYHLENVAGQLLVASWQPLANQFYSLIFFLLKEPEAHATLVEEVRTAFADSKDINMDTVGNLKYLQGCVQEGLRLHQETVDGLPRVSPGATVDGKFIPRGVSLVTVPKYGHARQDLSTNVNVRQVTCQISYFAASRSPRFFADPLKFRPARWLPQDDPRFDSRHRDDELRATKPFSQGLRGCPGGAVAIAVIRLFVAKVIWGFDLEHVESNKAIEFDKDFRFLTFWERPQYWVRFNPAQRAEEPPVRK
jgi:hypothetical protein